jgi:hypothetical protein
VPAETYIADCVFACGSPGSASFSAVQPRCSNTANARGVLLTQFSHDCTSNAFVFDEFFNLVASSLKYPLFKRVPAAMIRINSCSCAVRLFITCTLIFFSHPCHEVCNWKNICCNKGRDISGMCFSLKPIAPAWSGTAL